MATDETRAYNRAWYHANKNRISKRKQLSSKKNYNKCRAFILEFKKQPCKDCGGTFPTCVMDFDHQRDKKFTISNQYWRGEEAIREEIAKCDLVCANCHRIRTHVKKTDD